MTWRLGIAGDAFDLQAITKMTTYAGCEIERDPSGAAFLTSTAFSENATAREIRTQADQMLAKLNGLARLRNRHHQSVKLTGGMSRPRADGGRHHVMVVDSAVVRLRGAEVSLAIHRADGTIEKPSGERLDEKRLAKILGRDELGRIVTVLSKEITWQKLRIVYEQIGSLLGRSIDNAFVSAGYATRREIARFKANVQDPRLSGNDAVHGVSKGPLTETPMSLDEARAFVLGLLHKYVDDLD